MGQATLKRIISVRIVQDCPELEVINEEFLAENKKFRVGDLYISIKYDGKILSLPMSHKFYSDLMTLREESKFADLENIPKFEDGEDITELIFNVGE